MSPVIAESAISVRKPAGRATSRKQSDNQDSLPPRRPTSLRDAGLTLSQLSDFILKTLYLNGSQAGFEIGRELRLPFDALEETMRCLKEQRCLDVVGEEMPQPASRQLVLTELGRFRARDALDHCRYLGPAPVPLSSYVHQCRKQMPEGIVCSEEQFRTCFQHLVFPPALLAELGSAVCSGRSVLLYGPPGNGKTAIARALGELMSTQGGEIYVPYAILIENSVVTVFDPAVHQTTDHQMTEQGTHDLPSHPAAVRVAEPDSAVDLRWRRIRRPVVIAGGELTLDMLDLRHHAPGGYYTAPLHLKANGGLFVIDDIGRQPVSPTELLNRWSLPLEEGVDHLTLDGGNKVAVPFQQLLMFSTSRNLHDLVDESFLRRIRHRIPVSTPSREAFGQIFHNCCRARNFDYDRRHVEELFERHYNRQRLPRSSDPHDLLEMVAAVCRFRGEEPRLDAELLRIASERFFREV